MLTAFLIIGFVKSYGLFIVEFVHVYECSAAMASLIQGVQYAANGIAGIVFSPSLSLSNPTVYLIMTSVHIYRRYIFRQCSKSSGLENLGLNSYIETDGKFDNQMDNTFKSDTANILPSYKSGNEPLICIVF